MNHSNQSQCFNYFTYKQEIEEIEEERKDFLSLFDQLLLPSYGHDAPSLSDLYYYIPEVFIRQEENIVKLEEDGFQEVQQQPTDKHQSVRTQYQMCQEVKIQQITEKNNYSCQLSRCEKRSCHCFQDQKFKCSLKCNCVGRCNMIIKNIKKGVLTPFWSIDDLV